MVEKYENEKKLADILLVYGYDESNGSPLYPNKFPSEVAKCLEKSKLPNVRIEEYKGRVIDYDTEDDLHFSFNKFAEKFLPFDYAINLRDHVGSYEDERYNPSIDIFYQSKISINKKMNLAIFDYKRKLTSKAKGRSPTIITDYDVGREDEPNDWAYIDIQLYPEYVTRKEAFDQVMELLPILQKYPLDTTDHHLS